MASEEDKKQLLQLAQEEKGLQFADLVFWGVIVLPTLVGLMGFMVWGWAIAFTDREPERLEPLAWASAALTFGPSTVKSIISTHR